MCISMKWADGGIEAMADVLTRFGLGAVTGVDLPKEPDGLVPTPQWKRATRNESWYPGEDLITVIGQGYLMVTPMQLARMTATLVNRGIPVQPRLLLSKEDSLVVKPYPLMPPPNRPNPQRKCLWIRSFRKSMTAVMHSPRGTARASGRRSPLSDRRQDGYGTESALPRTRNTTKV